MCDTGPLQTGSAQVHLMRAATGPRPSKGEMVLLYVHRPRQRQSGRLTT